MPARSCIAALVATLALLAPPAARAQSGGGAGDSQYQDPFGSTGKPSGPKAKPKAPPAQQAPAQQQQTTPAPPPATTPAETQAQAQAQAAATQAATRASGQQTLPRTGFDAVPVAAIGLVLLLAGLALWRRPHAGR